MRMADLIPRGGGNSQHCVFVVSVFSGAGTPLNGEAKHLSAT